MTHNSKLTAIAAGVGLATAGGSAQAINLGEFWATDQIGGVTYIYKQSELNDPTVVSSPTLVDLTNLADADGVQRHSSVRMHISGFSNHAGLDPRSRAIQTYLDGWMEIWQTNGGTGAPTKIASLEASTNNAYVQEGLVDIDGNSIADQGNTVHACGGNPQNDQIQCASIFNGDFSLFSADMETDTYNRIGIWRVADLTVSNKLRNRLKNKVQAEFDDLVANDSNGNPNNICSEYSTDGNLLYLAVQNNDIDGGVIVVDVSDPYNPAILDAYNDVMAAGCGLVNNPDGESLWITHGFNKQGDPESVSIWKYSRAGKRHGPVKNIYLPTDDDKVTYGGDAHGAQFAGILNSFFWQTMRVDDKMQVISNRGSRSRVVNEFSLPEKSGRDVVSPDVLDRSQFGAHMYFSTRGHRPTTAVGNTQGIIAGPHPVYNSKTREPGVDVYSTLFGYSGRFVKHEPMTATGGTIYLCDDDPNDPVTGADGYPDQCDGTDSSRNPVLVSASDPHGTKSLNYLTGF